VPFVMVNQLALSVAVQAQPLVVVTVRLPLPPAAPIVGVVGATTKLHPAAACVIATVWPAAVSVALRDVVDVFAAAV
jgi:hypothetical protein